MEICGFLQGGNSKRFQSSGEIGLALGVSLLVVGLCRCATVGSEPRVTTVCPPVVEYSRDFQARAADELGMLPEGSAIAEMLADYSVMRNQARACR